MPLLAQRISLSQAHAISKTDILTQNDGSTGFPVHHQMGTSLGVFQESYHLCAFELRSSEELSDLSPVL